MRSHRESASLARAFALSLAAAVVTPIAWAVGKLSSRPTLSRAIAARHRHFASTLGRMSYYENEGVSGIPLMLFHGASETSSAYELRGLFEAFQSERPVIACDLPGFGFSERRAKPYARDDYVNFVEEMLEDVSRRYGSTVDIVAVGLAGELVGRAVIHRACFVRSIALVAPTGFAQTSRFGRMVLFGARKLANKAPGLLADPAVVEQVYDALPVPARFIHGDDERNPAAAIEAAVMHNRRLSRVRIDGAHALPHVELPNETANALRAFHRSLSRKPQLRVIRGQGVGSRPNPRGTRDRSLRSQ
ncbi:MAG: alpha/beta fold hydrolase [Polyangiaceae bacterium]|nr:alpha/beta fold hydrolase [Polyangiaceae bacterium]